MISFKSRRIVPYSIEDMYNLVCDVRSYPEFLPWCIGTHIIFEDTHRMIADMEVGRWVFSQKYRSHIVLTPYHSIEIESSDGPFNHMTTLWHFNEQDSHTMISYGMNMSIKNPFLKKATESFFSETSHKIIDAFEKRAKIMENQKNTIDFKKL
jgi:coenzyme Q-binding protein COQ10